MVIKFCVTVGGGIVLPGKGMNSSGPHRCRLSGPLSTLGCLTSQVVGARTGKWGVRVTTIVTGLVVVVPMVF